jgi:hypothetical protein
LKYLNKFQFTRTRFGNEKARRPQRSPEKLNKFCPSGESVCSEMNGRGVSAMNMAGATLLFGEQIRHSDKLTALDQ